MARFALFAEMCPEHGGHGARRRCRKCIKEKWVRYAAEHPSRIAAAQQRYKAKNLEVLRAKARLAYKPDKARDRHYSDIQVRARCILSRARQRSEQKGWEFGITLEWLTQRMTVGFCEATGIPFDMQRPQAWHGRVPFCPSIHRVDSTKGYTIENSMLVCWIYNAAVGPGKHEDVVRLARAVLASEQLLDEEVA